MHMPDVDASLRHLLPSLFGRRRSRGNAGRRYPSKHEPWLKLGRPIEQPECASRQVVRQAARCLDKEAWRDHRKERLLMHKLDRMRKIRQRRIDRGEIAP